MPKLSDNLASVHFRVEAACVRSGRAPSDVTLIAVTKTVGSEEVRALHALGVSDFGENRVQDGLPKALEIPEARWHFIGSLQRNKVRKALSGFSVIHSVDSAELAEQVARVAAETAWRGEVLVEVNVAGEGQKGGIPLAETEGFVRGLQGLKVSGLMTMAPLDADPEKARPAFRKLRELRDALGLRHLSMGMSQDFEVAVEEGATMVRVGTALFEGLA